MRLKVLHVTKTCFPSKGGTQQVLYQLTTGLKDKIHSFVLTAKEGTQKSKEKISGIFIRRIFSLGTVFSMPIMPLYPFWFWAYARKVDIVDYHYPFPLIDVLVSIYFPQKTKLVIHWHAEIVAQKNIAKLLSPFFHGCLKRADKIVVASPAYIENSTLLKKYLNKCEVIPYGVDVDFWQTLSFDQKDQINRLKEQYGKFLLAVGRLVPYKGFEVLLRALPPGITLMIVGSGRLEAALKTLSDELALTTQVVFLGEQNTGQLKCYLHACYLLAFPSISENEAFGLVQLEAMACAKPIINTRLNSAVPWVAAHLQEALSVPRNDAAAFIQAIQVLLNDEALAATLGQNGLSRVRSTFTIAQFEAKTYALYQQVMEPRGTMCC